MSGVGLKRCEIKLLPCIKVIYFFACLILLSIVVGASAAVQVAVSWATSRGSIPSAIKWERVHILALLV